jgi:LCP family protein required for cell wall assembly
VPDDPIPSLVPDDAPNEDSRAPMDVTREPDPRESTEDAPAEDPGPDEAPPAEAVSDVATSGESAPDVATTVDEAPEQVTADESPQDATADEVPTGDEAPPDATADDEAQDGAEPDEGVEPEGAPLRPRRAPVWTRALVVLGALLLVASLGGLIGGKLLIDRYAGSVHQDDLLGAARATASPVGGAGGGEPEAASIDGPLNILLVGIDERVNAEADGARSDSIIILHVPADHQSAYFISIPRDSRVKIPPYPKTGYKGSTDKINAAFAYGWNNGGGRAGGFELLALTIKNLTGISFNAGAIINFNGFTSVVDALGGVDMCVDEKTISAHIGWDANGKETPPYDIVPPGYTAVKISGVRPQVYEVGCQHMEGWEALDYVRQRELIPDGDYGRERHQQQFLKAVAKKLTSVGVLSNPLQVDSVLRAAADTLTFDGGGYSVTDWLFNLKSITPSSMILLKTNGGQFNTQMIGGSAFEILDDTSMQLFDAARDDTVDRFVLAHPDWVAGDGQS